MDILAEVIAAKLRAGGVAAPLLTTDQVAERLQVNEQTVRALIKSGELRGKKVGKFYRVEPGALDNYLAACDMAA